MHHELQVAAKVPEDHTVTADLRRKRLLQNGPVAVNVAVVASADKLNFIAVAGKDAVAAGAHSGKLVGAVASVTGGKGGGRPDNAMAGGQDQSKIDEALASAANTLGAMLK